MKYLKLTAKSLIAFTNLCKDWIETEFSYCLMSYFRKLCFLNFTCLITHIQINI